MAGYIKIDGVDGESTDKNHEQWIKIVSVGQGVHRPISVGSDGSTTKGSVSCGDIAVVKEVDKSTPKLIGLVCKGTKIGEIKIDLTTDTGEGERTVFLTWTLKNAYVSSYDVSGATDSGAPPTESLGLSYEEIEWTYKPVNKDGSPGGDIVQTWKVGPGTE